MNKSIFLFIFFFSNLCLIPGYSAIVKSGEEVTISSPVKGDLYIAGASLRIKATVDGDIVGAAGEIFVQDTIAEDAILAGWQIVSRSPGPG